MPSLGRILERLTVAVDADTSEADRKLQGLSDESAGGSWVGKLGGASSKAGAAMAVGIGGGIAAMAGVGLAAAVSSEQSMIAFTSIMGDAGKAKTFLADLSAFAAKTPFEMPALKDAASRMLAVGTEASRVIPIMTALGNSTSAMGTGSEGINRAVTALTQMQTKGKVTGEEMLQLAEAGVPAWDALATVMGVSVAEAQKKVSAGQVEANTLFKALETNAGPALGRVAGMMDKQSASAAGMLSTLKDTAMQGLGEMMAPALVSLKGAMPQITSMMGDMFKTIGPAVANMVPALVDLFKALAGALPGLVSGLAQMLPVITAVLGAVTWLMDKIPPGVILGVVAAFMLFAPVASIFSALAAILPILGAGFTILLGPVGLVILAVAALAAAGYLIYRNWSTIVDFFGKVPGMIGDGLAALPGLIGELAGMLVASWIKMQIWLAQTVWDGMQTLVGFFVDLPGRVLTALVNLPGLLVNAGSNLIRGLWVGAGDMFGKMWGFLTGLPGEIYRSIGDLSQLLISAGKNIIIGLWNGLASMGGWLWDKISDFVGNFVSGAIRGALKIFSPSQVTAEQGRMVALGLAEGILGGADAVSSAAGVLARSAQPGLSASSFASSGAVAGAGQPVQVLVSFDGAVMSMDELKRKVRVLFIDDGGRNALAAAAG